MAKIIFRMNVMNIIRNAKPIIDSPIDELPTLVTANPAMFTVDSFGTSTKRRNIKNANNEIIFNVIMYFFW